MANLEDSFVVIISLRFGIYGTISLRGLRDYMFISFWGSKKPSGNANMAGWNIPMF